METKALVEEQKQRIETLEQDLVKAKENLERANQLLHWYEEQFRLAQQHRFGSSRERTPAPEQINIFNEAEVAANPNSTEPELGSEDTEKPTESRKHRRKIKGKREADLKGLSIERIEHRLPAEEQTCPCCGGPLHEMSNEIHREVVVIPASVKVVEHVQFNYACRNCEHEELKTPIITAPMPAPVIPHSLASASAVAYVMVQKFVEGLPLYRQEQQFERLGIPFSRQNLANWMIIASEKWLTPLYNRMHQLLLKRDILHADESTIQVLDEPDRKATSDSYMWEYRTGREGPHIILFEYKPTRSGENPKRFLEGFKGYLHVDGYVGYEKLPDTIILVGCWAHARRYFVEALKALPPSKNNDKKPLAQEGLEYCDALFEIERRYKGATPEGRKEARSRESQLILDKFKAWLDEQYLKITPKSATGKAMAYCINQWNKLQAFMLDGRLELDNNRSERSIKPFVIGRKAWLFAKSTKGAKTSAVIYSIVETAKENDLNPLIYLEYILRKLPDIDINDANAIDALLPWSSSR